MKLMLKYYVIYIFVRSIGEYFAALSADHWLLLDCEIFDHNELSLYNLFLLQA